MLLEPGRQQQTREKGGKKRGKKIPLLHHHHPLSLSFLVAPLPPLWQWLENVSLIEKKYIYTGTRTVRQLPEGPGKGGMDLWGEGGGGSSWRACKSLLPTRRDLADASSSIRANAVERLLPLHLLLSAAQESAGAFISTVEPVWGKESPQAICAHFTLIWLHFSVGLFVCLQVCYI